MRMTMMCSFISRWTLILKSRLSRIERLSLLAQRHWYRCSYRIWSRCLQEVKSIQTSPFTSARRLMWSLLRQQDSGMNRVQSASWRKRAHLCRDERDQRRIAELELNALSTEPCASPIPAGVSWARIWTIEVPIAELARRSVAGIGAYRGGRRGEYFLLKKINTARIFSARKTSLCSITCPSCESGMMRAR